MPLADIKEEVREDALLAEDDDAVIEVPVTHAFLPNAHVVQAIVAERIVNAAHPDVRRRA